MQDGISTKDLSYLLGIRVSSLNELLAKMEKHDYIVREPSEADKRVMLVRLTEKGRQKEPREWEPGNLFACLSDEEQRTFADYLDRVNAAFASAIDGLPCENEKSAVPLRYTTNKKKAPDFTASFVISQGIWVHKPIEANTPLSCFQ